MVLVSDTECLLAKTNHYVGRSDVDDDGRQPRVAICVFTTQIKNSTVIKKFKLVRGGRFFDYCGFAAMALVLDTECLLAETKDNVGRSDVDDDDRRSRVAICGLAIGRRFFDNCGFAAMALVSDTECLLAETNDDVGRSDVDDDDGRSRVAISLRKTLIKISTVIKKFK
ncbi:hypothetical protein Acr_00g0059030 [Actinidia rufa]|uniref:Uncharacterized protein n=1 Tax=Actinidia rufa TaxID=165716 RepID=A0A7J0DQ13_9ERIC|nr:hypothetical protein Acr_00g0059030 [Actinidia rufa]